MVPEHLVLNKTGVFPLQEVLELLGTRTLQEPVDGGVSTVTLGGSMVG